MLTEICRWLIDTTVATSALLVGTLVAMRFLRQPAHRQRLGELALVGCLAMAAAHAIPGVPRISLAWFEANPRAMLSDGFYEDAIGAVKPADVSKTQAGAAGAHAASNVSAAPVAPVWEYAR